MPDRYNLERFVAAQDGVYASVVKELELGWKRGHWMWFVFPQIAGLGHSATAQKYAIGSRAEAAAYLAHPVLGPRLRECTALINAIEGRDIRTILGYPDDLKFKSCMTLFASVADDKALFLAALDKYYEGQQDELTLARL